MDDFENIIKKYQKELMEFSLQNPLPKEKAIPVFSEQLSKNENIISVVEDPQPVAEEPGETTAFPMYTDYDEFLKSNTEKGSLRIQVFAGDRFFPIPNARVRVTLPLLSADDIQLSDALTDINGVVDNIVLPAPPVELSQSPETAAIRPFAFYTIKVEHPKYATSQFVNVPVFAGVKSIQDVQLVPLTESGDFPDNVVRFQSDPFIALRGAESNGYTNNT